MADTPTPQTGEDEVNLLPMDPFLESLTPKRDELLEVLNRFSTEVKDLSR